MTFGEFMDDIGFDMFVQLKYSVTSIFRNCKKNIIFYSFFINKEKKRVIQLCQHVADEQASYRNRRKYHMLCVLLG